MVYFRHLYHHIFLLSMIMKLVLKKNDLHYLLKVKCGSKPRGGQVILPLDGIGAEDRETQTF